MKFDAKGIEKKLRNKKKNIATLKYQKTHPEVKKKHAKKNYLKYRDKRLISNKLYYQKNKDKFKNYNRLSLMALKFKFVLEKDNKEIIASTKQTIRKLKEGWTIKSVDWSKLI